MTVDLDHPEVARYLARLSQAVAGLPQGRREELIEEIRGHLADALAMTKPGDDAAVRAALDRLGSPEDIAAAEGAPTEVAVALAPARRPAWGAVEIAAVLCLTVGLFVLPIVGPIAGLVLTWVSTAWTRTNKVVATVLVLVPLLLLGVLAPLALLTFSSTGPTPTCPPIDRDSPVIIDENC